MILTPRSCALWYGRPPSKAGRKEWWMLMVRLQLRSQNSLLKICKVAHGINTDIRYSVIGRNLITSQDCQECFTSGLRLQQHCTLVQSMLHFNPCLLCFWTTAYPPLLHMSGPWQHPPAYTVLAPAGPRPLRLPLLQSVPPVLPSLHRPWVLQWAGAQSAHQTAAPHAPDLDGWRSGAQSVVAGGGP